MKRWHVIAVRCLMLKGIGITLVLVALSNVSMAAESPRRPAMLEGLHVSGNAVTAKTDGFTQCLEGYSYYRCTASKPLSIMGIHAISGFVDLSPVIKSANVTETPMDELSYTAVSLVMDQEAFDPKCVKKAQAKTKGSNVWEGAIIPEECIVPGGIATLIAKLKTAGWLPWFAGRAGTYYFSAESSVRITVRTGHPPTANIILEVIPESEAKAGWKRASEDAAEKAKAGRKANDFINSMKQ